MSGFLPTPRKSAGGIFRFGLLALLLLGLTGTRACQEDYFFATQSNLGSSSASSESEASSSATSSSKTSASSLFAVSSESSVSSVSVSSAASSGASSSAKTATQVSSVMPLLAELQRLSQDKRHALPQKEAQGKGQGTVVDNWLSNLSRKGKRRDSDKPSHSGADTDGDGFTDGLEYRLGSDWRDPESVPVISASGSLSRLRAEDRDLDGIPDKQEIKIGTNPVLADSDGDGVSDGAELFSGTDPLNSTSKPEDSDGDGLSDEYEASIGTDSFNPDSDLDGLRDDAEIALHTGPLNKDTDNDGILDGKEIELGTDPLRPDN